MEIALRERNLDSRLCEKPQDRHPQSVLRLQPDIDALDPGEESKVERAVAESGEQRARMRHLLHLGNFRSRSLEQTEHLLGVAAIRDPDVDFIATFAIGQR